MAMHGPMGGGMPLEIGEGKVVTGIPLTAQIVVSHETVLSDGNRISRTSQMTLYRDAQGRVRRDITVEIGTPSTGTVKHTIVTINDPVSGHRYTLDPENKTARESPERKGPHGPNGPGREMLRGMLSKSVQQEQLGTKTIVGFQAEGMKVTRTIAAGEIGNEKPIEVVTERWFSTDLELPLLIIHTDPMMGTATIKVASVTRGDPDASLFQVPSDYKLVSGRRDEPFYVPLHP